MAGVIVDTMVISWLLRHQFDPRTERYHYHSLIGDRPVLLAFQTVMELRYGTLRTFSRVRPCGGGWFPRVCAAQRLVGRTL